MCGIFGSIAPSKVNKSHLKTLVSYSRQRGIDSSGIAYFSESKYEINRANYDISKLIRKVHWEKSKVVLGHSRLVTNGLLDNQPVVRDNIFLIHNGILVNEEEIWSKVNAKRLFEIDSEAIIALTLEYLNSSHDLKELSEYILNNSDGTISAALAMPS